MISQAPSLSLALQYHQSGQLEVAAKLYEEILDMDPESAEARHLLGVLALQAGNYDLAAKHIERAIRTNNGVAAFHCNLGIAYRSLRKLDRAIACFRQAIKLAPRQADAYNNLAGVLQEQGKVQEAIVAWRRAVALMPNYVDAWLNRAIALRQAGNLEECITCLGEVHRLRPDRADYCNNLASALHQLGKRSEAIALYRRAIELDPTFAPAQNNLGNVLQEQGQFAEACQCYRRAAELKPDFAEAYLGLASTQNERGNSAEAIRHYLTAIRINPALAAAHCNLGIVLEEQGDLAGAEKCFRSAITGDFHYAAAHSELASLLRAKLPAADMEAQQCLLANPTLPQAHQAALHFGLAQVFDARGAFAEAARHSRAANSSRLIQWKKEGQEYDPAGHSQFVDEILAEFTPEFFARVHEFGVPSDRPVFLVGLPRSGTTLLEQILASHSQVFAAGELTLARDAFASTRQNMPKPRGQWSAWSREGIQGMAFRHLQELQRRNLTALRVVDKMPDNYLYLGLLAALFPRARFIHCRRDLRDVAVSCWMANFRAVRWASDPGHIVARFQDYQRLMDHWRNVLPAPILDVSYEETVADLETVARRLIAWCGLPWEPTCLEYYRTKRPVRTASAIQVRRPIFNTSVGRWKHYEQSLAMLLEKLPAQQ
jgi:tetratricopeptide (TPR) repeat protein